jgi:hypothetical protein
MESNLLSLSLSEYTNNKTFDIANLFMTPKQSGGDFSFTKTTNLIISISLIAVATFILIGNSNWVNTYGHINYSNNVEQQEIIGISYLVNGLIYTKELTIDDKKYIDPNNKLITLSYEITNPTHVRLGHSNYNILITILYIAGAIFFALWNSTFEKWWSEPFRRSNLNSYSKSDISSEIYNIGKIL